MTRNYPPNLPFNIWILFEEEHLRGKWVTVSAHLEFLLSKIIIYCHAKNPTVIHRFENTKFWQKLNWAKEDLNKTYPDLFIKFRDSFKKIKKLAEIRNHVAHYSMLFDPEQKDKSFLTLRAIVYIDGENKMEVIRYQIEYLEQKFSEFKDVTKDMINTWIHLVNDFSKDDPTLPILSSI